MKTVVRFYSDGKLDHETTYHCSCVTGNDIRAWLDTNTPKRERIIYRPGERIEWRYTTGHNDRVAYMLNLF